MTTIKTNSWSAKTCDQCHVTNGNGKHTTYTLAAHTATTSGCTMGACHGSTTDVRTLHDRSTSGCTATGTDSQGWTGGCHALNKSMTGTTMTCGDTGACHNNHTASNHGGSPGGQACYGCHGSYQASMEDGAGTTVGSSRASSVHHVMGSATLEGDIAPNTGTYPTSTTDVYCVSCHADHNYFNLSRGANLRSNIANASGAATSNSDYSSTSPYGICVSCHATAKAKQGMGTDQLNVGGANTPVIGGAQLQHLGPQLQRRLKLRSVPRSTRTAPSATATSRRSSIRAPPTSSAPTTARRPPSSGRSACRLPTPTPRKTSATRATRCRRPVSRPLPTRTGTTRARWTPRRRVSTAGSWARRPPRRRRPTCSTSARPARRCRPSRCPTRTRPATRSPAARGSAAPWRRVLPRLPTRPRRKLLGPPRASGGW